MSKRQQVLELVRSWGVLRPRELAALGIAGEYLNKLHAAGALARPGRGLYALPDQEPDEWRGLAEVCARAPRAVACLLTALRFHGLTTAHPFETWLAVGPKAHPPRLDHPPLRVVHFSPPTLAYGVQTHALRAGVVRVFSPAKTVADCFKQRRLVGLDLALEALRECWRERRATGDELWAAAQACRMTNVMRPYLEAVCG